MTRKFVVNCSHRGSGPRYVACVHIIRKHAPVTHWIRATEVELGEALCQKCANLRNGFSLPDINDLLLVCARCMAPFLKGEHGHGRTGSVALLSTAVLSRKPNVISEFIEEIEDRVKKLEKRVEELERNELFRERHYAKKGAING